MVATVKERETASRESTLTYLRGCGAAVGEGSEVDEAVCAAVIGLVGLVADVQAATTNANTTAAARERDDAIRKLLLGRRQLYALGNSSNLHPAAPV
jgi:hypothetical protein